jgi:filamentous hemagglutinin
MDVQFDQGEYLSSGCWDDMAPEASMSAGEGARVKTQDSYGRHSKTHTETSDTTTVGNSISGSKGIALFARQDINAIAATITSGDGAVIAHAGRDIHLLAGEDTHSESIDQSHTKYLALRTHSQSIFQQR